MKHFNKTVLSIITIASSYFAMSGQTTADSTGYDGDHFSLEAALESFKSSETLEDFEKNINEENNRINNLDLDQNGEIDYVRIEDHVDGNTHVIVLQVPLGEHESQDIATIEIEKTGEENAILQIVGNEDVYGSEKLIEPYEVEGRSTGKGPDGSIDRVRIVVNVWFWPSVRYIYRPNYRVYVSPYRWRVYPRWWNPFRPRPWKTFYTAWSPFRTYYRPIGIRRVNRSTTIYASVRKTSPRVKSRTVTRTKTTTVVRSNGTVSANKKRTTTVSNARGNSATVSKGKSTTLNKTNQGVTVNRTKKAQVTVEGKNKKASVSKTKSTKVSNKNGNTKKVKKTKTKVTKKKKNG